MARLFTEHLKRHTRSLDGAWYMQPDPEDVGRASGWAQTGLPHPVRTVVPSVWNTDLSYLAYEGVMWYEVRFHTEAAEAARLAFGAVMTEAEVYLDGQRLGGHYGGFCPFTLDAPPLLTGEHRLCVRVDNRHDAHSIPQRRVDWYPYGGITRSVTLHALAGLCVLAHRTDYTLTGDRAAVKTRVTLRNVTDAPLTDALRIFVENRLVCTQELTFEPKEERDVLLTYPLDGIERWSPDAPRLYTLRLETGTDDLIDRLGFRTVRVEGGALLLNDVPLRLHGINRHEEHPDFGMAFPPALMKRDIDIAREMGCNALRGAHYPNDPLFVDLLDEVGMIFWSEIPIWGVGFSEEALADELVLQRGLRMHEEMVREYYHHPSILLWGMHNEIDTTTDAAVRMTELYYDLLKREGGGRPVTYASNHPFEDRCFALCDIISINRYIGWYDGEIEDVDRFLDELERHKAALGFADKPTIMSEFGAAAIYGHHTFDGTRWTEEYQARLLEVSLAAFLARPDHIGTFVWQFADLRTSRAMGTDRARGFNNKGVLNEHRKPKLAFRAVQTAYREDARRHAPDASEAEKD